MNIVIQSVNFRAGFALENFVRGESEQIIQTR